MQGQRIVDLAPHEWANHCFKAIKHGTRGTDGWIMLGRESHVTGLSSAGLVEEGSPLIFPFREASEGDEVNKRQV
ncbi:hypothetical protein GCM10007981_05080 [Thermocladium modestius]|uniref:Uncharacterized protein n=1 Tax=Thermocladium modestius TaxID=62609 RepID=A0A830GUH3_9CREN|nr:hypothetical protein GCM10007981_05080 [Thermocladium modestius]